MKIVPMRELKDTVKIEKLCQEYGKVFVTKNGYDSLVVMSSDYYNELFEELEEIRDINKGLEDVKNGKVIDHEALMAEIKKEYGI